MNLKPITHHGIPAALQKAERSRWETREKSCANDADVHELDAILAGGAFRTS